MPMTITEKIIAAHAGRDAVRPLDHARGRPEPVEGRPATEARTGEKKKPGLSENEGRVPGEAEKPGAETPDQKAEGQEGPSLPPHEPAKQRKLDEAMMDPLIQKAIRLFDGRIVNIED